MGKQVAMILRLFCKNGNFIQIEYRQKLIVQKATKPQLPLRISSQNPNYRMQGNL